MQLSFATVPFLLAALTAAIPMSPTSSAVPTPTPSAQPSRSNDLLSLDVGLDINLKRDAEIKAKKDGLPLVGGLVDGVLEKLPIDLGSGSGSGSSSAPAAATPSVSAMPSAASASPKSVIF